MRISGLPGKVYVPEEEPACAKKHDCRDCFACQRCGDDRCSLCLTQKACVPPAPLKPPQKRE